MVPAAYQLTRLTVTLLYTCETIVFISYVCTKRFHRLPDVGVMYSTRGKIAYGYRTGTVRQRNNRCTSVLLKWQGTFLGAIL